MPTYGNVEALLVQICAFLAHSNARVASLAAKGGGTAAAGGAAGGDGEQPAPPHEDADEAQRKKAQRAYDNLKAFHAKKGWSQPAANVS